jgi:hypothetical protein
MLYIPVLTILALLFNETVAQQQGNVQKYWNNYPDCARKCKQDVYSAGISGCQLRNDCLCKAPFWLHATARCVLERCGAEELESTAKRMERACKSTGTPMIISSQTFIEAGYGGVALPPDSASNSGGGGSSMYNQ